MAMQGLDRGGTNRSVIQSTGANGVTDGVFGFFLGAAPGVIMAVRNGITMQRIAARASELAKEHGEYFDFRYSLSDRANYFIRPARFVRKHDGTGVQKGKQLLLEARRPFFIRYAQSVIVTGVGAILGVLIALAI
jgi:hypothetical protein